MATIPGATTEKRTRAALVLLQRGAACECEHAGLRRLVAGARAVRPRSRHGADDDDQPARRAQRQQGRGHEVEDTAEVRGEKVSQAAGVSWSSRRSATFVPAAATSTSSSVLSSAAAAAWESAIVCSEAHKRPLRGEERAFGLAAADARCGRGPGVRWRY